MLILSPKLDMWSGLSFPTQTRLKFDLHQALHIDSTIPLHGSIAVTKVKHVNVMELCDMVRIMNHVIFKEMLTFLAATFVSFITSCLLMIVQWSVRNITDVTVGPGGRSLDNGIPMCVS